MRRPSSQTCITTLITTRRTHTVHHHTAPAPVVTAPAPQAGPFGLALPHIAPYPDNQGDEDGLSRDPDDCMKGCIGGNPQ